MFLFFTTLNTFAKVNSIDVEGCTNPFACNYNPEATIDDGSCDFISCITFGCTHEIACNYDANADYDDGSCEYTTCLGCMNELACDFDPEATIAGVCDDFESCVGLSLIHI